MVHNIYVSLKSVDQLTYFCLISDKDEMILGKTEGHATDKFPIIFLSFYKLSGPRNCNIWFNEENRGLYDIFDRFCHDRFVFKESIKSDSWQRFDKELIHSMFGAHISIDNELMKMCERYCSGYMAKDIKLKSPDNS